LPNVTTRLRTALALCGVLVIGALTGWLCWWIQRTNDSETAKYAVYLAALAVDLPLLGSLYSWWRDGRPRPFGDAERAIGQVLDDRDRPVGMAFAIGARKVVTSAQVVRAVLGSPTGDRAPAANGQIPMRFQLPAAEGRAAGRLSRVDRWGTPDVGCGTTDLTVLHLEDPLPAGVPHLRVHESGYSGQVVLFGPQGGNGRSLSCAEGEVRNNRFQTDREPNRGLRVTDRFSGSPILPPDSDMVVGVAQATRTDSNDAEVDLIGTDDLQILRHHRDDVEGQDRMSRRQMLLAVAGSAAIGACGLTAWDRTHQPPVADALGWRELLEDSELERAFRRSDSPFTVKATDKSGVELLYMSYALAICPDSNIANLVKEKYGSPGHAAPEQVSLFRSPMVILARTQVRDQLMNAGLVYSNDSKDAPYQMFDLRSYVRTVTVKTPKTRVLPTANPCSAASGNLYLAALANILEGEPEKSPQGRLAKLLTNSAEKTSSALSEEFIAQTYDWIFTYEHEALLRLHQQYGSSSQLRDFVLLYPDPAIDSVHYAVGTSDIVKRIGACMRDQRVAEHLATTLYLRSLSPEKFCSALQDQKLEVVITGGHGPLAPDPPIGKEDGGLGTEPRKVPLPLNSDLANWRKRANCTGLK
jgi:hypothetical protein